MLINIISNHKLCNKINKLIIMSNMKFAFYSKEGAFIITVNARLSLQLRPWKAANAECGADYRRKQNCYYMDLELPKQHIL